MTKHSVFGAALITASLALVAPAQAGDAFAKRLDGSDVVPRATQALIDQCQSDDSTSRAVLACTKLIRLASTADDQAAVMTRRGMHRLERGNLQAAAADFRRAGEMSENTRLASLGTGFAAIASNDLETARVSFETCTAMASIAPLAHYGLGLTEHAAGDDAAARANYQQALALSPDFDSPRLQMRRLS